MYTQAGADLRFGDVFRAEWLFDSYVRADSAAMFKRTFSGGIVAWIPRGQAPDQDGDYEIMARATMDPDDVVLTLGHERMAMVLSDDCEIANLTGNREQGWPPRGRVLMGAVRKLDDKQRDDLELGIHPLPADEALGFPGGLVDFNRLFEVQTKSLLDASDQKALSLDDEDRYTLGERFAGHLLRQGAFAAGGNARKLSRLLTAGDDIELLKQLSSDADNWGDPETAARTQTLIGVASEAWWLGRLTDQVDDYAERLHRGELADGEEARAQLRMLYATSLRALIEKATASLEALEGKVDPQFQFGSELAGPRFIWRRHASARTTET